MKKIAIFTPIHRRPDLVVDQIKNYSKFFGEHAVHVLHPSIQGQMIVPEVLDELSDMKNSIHIVHESWNTSWTCIFGAFLGCSDLLNSIDQDIGTIYLHTDADLLIKGDVVKWIQSKRIAYSAYQIPSGWRWEKKLLADQRFVALTKHIGIKREKIVSGRQEGAFIPKDLWLEAIQLISYYYPKSYFDDVTNHWPIEECVLPTVLHFLEPASPCSQILVRTKEVTQLANPNPRDDDNNVLNVSDIQKVLDDDNYPCAGMKWFSQNYDDLARVMVREFKPS